MSKIFHWTRKKRGLLRSTLNLFLDDVLFGTITDYTFETPAKINGRKYAIQFSNSLLIYPKRHKLIDFDSNKVICEIEHHFEDRQIFAIFANNLKYELTPDPGNPSQTNGQVVQSYGDTLWFPDSGKLEVRTDKNIEALIVCFYFAGVIDFPSV